MGGYRYTFDDGSQPPDSIEPIKDGKSFDTACKFLWEDTLGQTLEAITPFGKRRILYADFAASGRLLKSFETFIQSEVAPYYGNTHTLTSTTGRQSTYYRNEARQIIKSYLNATHEDALIFCGAGCTGAITKLIQILDHAGWTNAVVSDISSGSLVSDGTFKEDRFGSFECQYCKVTLKSESACRSHSYMDIHRQRVLMSNNRTERESKPDMPTSERTIVFLCDPALHHSSLLKFRNSPRGTDQTKYDFVPLLFNDETGLLSTEHLERELKLYSKENARIGTQKYTPFFVGVGVSNVTGCVQDVERVTQLVHQHKGLVLWDFAAAAGHIEIDINPVRSPDSAIDFAVFSPHKMLGGPGSPGLLLIKKKFLLNQVPSEPGGGSVFFVSGKETSYIQNYEEREEAGTPHIMGCIRAGLTFKLHSQFKPKLATNREFEFAEFILKKWRNHSRIDILGNSKPNGIISFMIRYGNNQNGVGVYLHHNFVSAILNDVFGIQTRSGCACAGPLSQYLLGMTPNIVHQFFDCLEKSGQEVFRPGFVRVSLNYSMNWDDVEIIAQGVLWVAEFGWQLLPLYTFIPETGNWEHRLCRAQQTRKWISQIQLNLGLGQESTTIIPRSVDSPTARKDPSQVAGIGKGMAPSVADELAQRLRAGTALTKARAQPPIPNAVVPTETEWQRKVRMRQQSAVPNTVPPAGTTTPAWGGSSTPTKSVTSPDIASALKSRIGSQTARTNEGPKLFEDIALARTRTNPKIGETVSKKPSWVKEDVEAPEDTAVMFTRSPHHKAEPPSDNETDKVGRRIADAANWAEVPLELGELLDAANKLLENLFAGGSARKLNISKSLVKSCVPPPLPTAFAHLLWFALPTDGAESLKKTEGYGRDAYPQLDMNSTVILWTGTGNPKRPENAIFSVGSQLTAMKSDRLDYDACLHYISTSKSKDLISHRLDVLDGFFRTTTITEETQARLCRSEIVRSVIAIDMFSAPARILNIPIQLRRSIGTAIRDHSMIREGDRILVGLSGGKDSLTLLHCLLDLMRRAPIKFTVAAATVDPQTPEYNPAPLAAYLGRLGVTHHMLSEPIIQRAKIQMDPKRESICSFCARMKRGILYTCMRQNNYNLLALGQHLDDICESFLMSAFHNGILNTMKAHYTISAGDLRVCRPLIRVRERDLAAFARENNLPVIADNCPACFSAPKERHRIKMLLAQQEFEHPHVFQNLHQTLKPLVSRLLEEEEGPPLCETFSRSGDVSSQDGDEADIAAETCLTSCHDGACPKK